MKKSDDLKKIAFSLAILAFSLLVSMLLTTKDRLAVFYPNIVPNPDFFFNILPFYNLSVVVDIIEFIGILGFVVFLTTKKRGYNTPYYATVFGLFYIVRTFLVFMTPLADPSPVPFWGLGIFLQAAGFPSGHFGAVLLFYLFSTEEKNTKRWQIFFLILSIVIGIGLILSRGHYSVDIFGAIFVDYAIWMFCKRYKKDFVIKN